MIDYYYEFPEGSKFLGESVRFAFQRGYHPDLRDMSQRVIRNEAYGNAIRMWIENANGLVLVREHGLNVHKKCDSKELTWIKLQAREL